MMLRRITPGRAIRSCACLVLMAIALTPVCSGVAQPLASPHTVTIRLFNFGFDPERLRLRAGVPVRLRLVNDSGGNHDFSAPAFFASSAFPAGVLAPARGRIEVSEHGTVAITLVPTQPGIYRLTCTHFLHSAFGMTGTIEVTDTISGG